MDKKVERIISLYNRVIDGEMLVKADEAARFGVNERSIQRDIEDLRAYFANDPESDRELIYDRSKKGYVLVRNPRKMLTNSEVLAVCKILLESRSLVKEEMYPIIDKLLQCCVPYGDRFQEGEFRKRIQFMFGGELRTLRFKYKGISLEAVLDRLPTVEILAHDETGWIIKAEVYGDGVDMWLRSQGNMIEIIEGGKANAKHF